MAMLIRLLLCLLLLPSIVSAAVITTNEWESKPGFPWAYAGTAVDCTVTPSPSGGCALQFTYAAGTYSTSFSGGRAEYTLPAGITDLYLGAWMRYSSPASWQSIGQKINQFAMDGAVSSTGFPNNIQLSWTGGASSLSGTQQIVWGDGSVNHYCNLTNFTGYTNEWKWVEFHVQLNTPGLADGVYDSWVNDVQCAHYTNISIRDSSTSASAGWANLHHTAEWGGGGGTVASTCAVGAPGYPCPYYWWVDHTVISTTRIGMPGGTVIPTPDTTPPTQVSGASATASGDTSIMLTWTAATDANGIARYNLVRCSGAACTTFASIGSTASTTFTDTGLTASTLYRYTITAQDPSGNLGTSSAIVEATTSATPASGSTRRTTITETFDRADNLDLGASWDAGYTGRDSCKIVGNRVRATTNSNECHETYNATSLANDQWAQATFSSLTATGWQGILVAVRNAAPATRTYYAFHATNQTDSNSTSIERCVAGTCATLATAIVPWIQGDILRGEVQGSTLRLYRNNVLVVSATDTNIPTGSRAGIAIYTADITLVELDNFSAGDFQTTTPPSITNATVDTTGATLTYGATAPTAVLVQVTGSVAADETVTPATIAGGLVGIGSDTFTRADGADLGANWTTVDSAWALATNAAQVAAANSSMREVETSTLSANQWAQVTLSSFAGTVETYVGPITRNPSTNGDGYSCVATRGAAGDGTRLVKRISGVNTNLTTESTTVWAASDTLRIESEGTTHRCYRNGALLLTTTDGDIATGYAGMGAYIGVGGTASDVRLDNFLSGNLTPLDTNGRYTRSWVNGQTSVSFYAVDALGAVNTTAGQFVTANLTGITNIDTTPPVISGGAPTTALAAGTTSITESWATNEPAICRRSTTDQAYSAMTQTATTVNGLTHTWAATGLANNTTYTIYVRCTDQYPTDTAPTNNINTTSYSFSYSVAAAGGDITAPSTVSNLVCIPVGTSGGTCTFTAATDNTAVTGYEAWICLGDACSSYSIINPTWSVSTTQSIGGLTAGLSYTVKMKAFDAAGNRSAAFSNTSTFVTNAQTDITPPSDMTGLTVSASYRGSLLLSWTAGTDNSGVLATPSIEACAGAACTDYAPITIIPQSTTSALVPGLNASTTYRFRGKHKDGAGNASTAFSSVVQGTTGSSGLTRPRVGVPELRPRTGSGTRTPR